MQQLDYVFFAYATAFFILGSSALMIFKKDQTLRKLLDNLKQS